MELRFRVYGLKFRPMLLIAKILLTAI